MPPGLNRNERFRRVSALVGAEHTKKDCYDKYKVCKHIQYLVHIVGRVALCVGMWAVLCWAWCVNRGLHNGVAIEYSEMSRAAIFGLQSNNAQHSSGVHICTGSRGTKSFTATNTEGVVPYVLSIVLFFVPLIFLWNNSLMTSNLKSLRYVVQDLGGSVIQAEGAGSIAFRDDGIRFIQHLALICEWHHIIFVEAHIQ